MSDTDMVSVTNLIRLVRERPVLWDRQEEVYKNRKLTRKAWEEICVALVPDYQELEDHERKAIGKSVAGKWANLRDNWLRYWRKRQEMQRISLSTEGLKKYVHHDRLLFLSKVYESDELQQEVEEIQVDVDVLSDPDDESQYGLNFDENSQNLYEFPGEVEKSEEIVEQTQKERHIYFFHSIMPLIEDFDNGQILDFQTSVLECIKRAKYRNSFVNVVQPQFLLAFTPKQEIVQNKEDAQNSSAKVTSTDGHPSKLQSETSKEQIKASAVSITTEQSRNASHLKENLQRAEENKKTDSKQSTLTLEDCSKPVSEFTNLQNVVNKLERISVKFASKLNDPYDKFGKYLGSLLREIPPKQLKMLKKRIVREILRVKVLGNEKSLKSSQRKFRPASTDFPLDTNSHLNNLNPTSVSVTNHVANTKSDSSSSNLEGTLHCKLKIKDLNNLMSSHLGYSNNSHSNSIYQADGDYWEKNNGQDRLSEEDDVNPSAVLLKSLFRCKICTSACVSRADLYKHYSDEHSGDELSHRLHQQSNHKTRKKRKRKSRNSEDSS